MNKYNEIAEQYQKSDTKPDKLFSILPTVLKLVGDLRGKTVLDMGCGDGFFTERFVQLGADRVIGMDNSEKQIELAKKVKTEKTEYRLGDIFVDELPKADVINSPFVLNYAKDLEMLSAYFRKLFNALNNGGRLVLVYDLPSGKDLKKFGARKILSEDRDGADLTIELYNQEKLLCTLHVVYFKEETIRTLLEEVGFEHVSTYLPIISEEGLKRMGEEYWKGYREGSELGYLTAEKP